MVSIASDAVLLRDRYPTVVIGSGYGGAITAARLAEAGQPVCILERGREWHVGEFPDTLKELAGNVRGKRNPLGLIDYYLCRDIDVLKGNGLGGTSLVNLNVAFRPDAELFGHGSWPKAIRDEAESGAIWDHYDRAEAMLRPRHHPRWNELTKVQMVEKRAKHLHDSKFGPTNITVSFEPSGPNHVGVEQDPCIDCGDCFPGCNVGAKNTLMMNYLPYARQKGAEIFTRVEVLWVEKAGDGWTVHYRVNEEHRTGEPRTLQADRVVLAAGAVGSTEILLRSRHHGLATSGRLGHTFSGNGDYIGLAYNTDHRTNVLGFGNHPDSTRAQVAPGPTIVSAIQYDRSGPFAERITVEDFAVFPSALVDFFRRTVPGLALTGTDTDHGFKDKVHEMARIGADLAKWTPDGALNHSMLYLVMAVDDAGGVVSLDDDDKVDIVWPSVKKDPIFDRIADEIESHSRELGGTFVHLARLNPWPRKPENLITAHPLGGCTMADDPDHGVVDDRGRVFADGGEVHDGLYVIDGAMVPSALAVNPFLTISALAERSAALMT